VVKKVAHTKSRCGSDLCIKHGGKKSKCSFDGCGKRMHNTKAFLESTVEESVMFKIV